MLSIVPATEIASGLLAQVNPNQVLAQTQCNSHDIILRSLRLASMGMLRTEATQTFYDDFITDSSSINFRVVIYSLILLFTFKE